MVRIMTPGATPRHSDKITWSAFFVAAWMKPAIAAQEQHERQQEAHARRLLGVLAEDAESVARQQQAAQGLTLEQVVALPWSVSACAASFLAAALVWSGIASSWVSSARASPLVSA